MSKYDNFETFVTTVVDEANSKCRSRYGKSLTDIYEVSDSIYSMIMSIIPKGWHVFLALVLLIAMGPIAFAASLIGFSVTPIGIIVLTALAAFGGVTAIKILYRNRILPMAIKDMGEKFKDRFNSHINECGYIDNMIDEASDYLIRKAKNIV